MSLGSRRGSHREAQFEASLVFNQGVSRVFDDSIIGGVAGWISSKDVLGVSGPQGRLVEAVGDTLDVKIHLQRASSHAHAGARAARSTQHQSGEGMHLP